MTLLGGASRQLMAGQSVGGRTFHCWLGDSWDIFRGTDSNRYQSDSQITGRLSLRDCVWQRTVKTLVPSNRRVTVSIVCRGCLWERPWLLPKSLIFAWYGFSLLGIIRGGCVSLMGST
jgi:hypothetical protein